MRWTMLTMFDMNHLSPVPPVPREMVEQAKRKGYGKFVSEYGGHRQCTVHCKDGQIHREFGPAIHGKNLKVFVHHGKMHKYDGYAYINDNLKMYVVHGMNVTRFIMSNPSDDEIDQLWVAIKLLNMV